MPVKEEEEEAHMCLLFPVVYIKKHMYMCLIKQQLAYIGPYNKSETCEKDKTYFKFFGLTCYLHERLLTMKQKQSHMLDTENTAKGYA